MCVRVRVRACVCCMFVYVCMAQPPSTAAACVPGTCARRSSQSWSAAPARFRFCGPRGPGRIEFGTNHGTAIEYVLMRARVSARVRE